MASHRAARRQRNTEGVAPTAQPFDWAPWRRVAPPLPLELLAAMGEAIDALAHAAGAIDSMIDTSPEHVAGDAWRAVADDLHDEAMTLRLRSEEWRA